MRPNAQTVELVSPTVTLRKVFMSDIYVMQRANGDVFALDDHGRFRAPTITGLPAQIIQLGKKHENRLESIRAIHPWH